MLQKALFLGAAMLGLSQMSSMPAIADGSCGPQVIRSDIQVVYNSNYTYKYEVARTIILNTCTGQTSVDELVLRSCYVRSCTW
jgi:hypothetical protein